MTLKQRLFFLQFVALIPWILGSLLIVNYYYPKAKAIGYQLKGIDYLPKIYQIILSIQKIRGFTYHRAFVKEPKKREHLGLQIRKEEEALQRLFKDVENQLQREEQREDYLKIQSLERSFYYLLSKEDLKPFDKFMAYTELIHDFNEFLAAMGYKYHLYEESDLLTRTLAQTSLLEIPKMTEALGILRGLGAGILQQKKWEPERQKMLLKFYSIIIGYRGALEWSLKNIKYPSEVYEQIDKSLNLLQSFLDNFERTFILKTQSMSPEGYFIMGTYVMETMYLTYQAVLHSLKKRFKAHQILLLKHGFAIFLAFSLIFGSICAIFYISYLSILKKLKKIEEGAEKISGGDLSYRISVEGKDEINKLGDLLNKSLDELQKKIEEIYYLSYHDPLTQLPNREKLLQDLSYLKHPAILLLDISNFKDINIVYGKECGDLILKSLAEFLTSRFPNKVYRLGPDEFSVVFDLQEENWSTEKFCNLMHNFSAELQNLNMECADEKITLTIFSACNSVLDEPSKMLVNTYSLLKEGVSFGDLFICGKEKYESLSELSKEYLFWLKKIKQSLAEDLVKPYYQPIFDNKNKRVDKFEALVRIEDEDGTIYAPLKFLEISRKIGLYSKITQRVIEKVIEDFKGLPFEVSINFASKDFESEDIRKFLLMYLQANNRSKSMLPSSLVLEILESEELRHSEVISQYLQELKKLGIKLSIDDFGIGYSNLNRLIELQVDYIKIDSTIIKRLPTDDKAQKLVRAILSFAKESGIKTIAEFVANAEIFKVVCDFGIDYSQGFYISPPLSFEELKNKDFFQGFHI